MRVISPTATPLAALVVGIVGGLSACGPGAPDLLTDWNNQAVDHGDMGTDGSFAFASRVDENGNALSFQLAGALALDALPAPLTISGSALEVAGAVVGGETGTLNFQGGAVRFDEGTVSGASAGRYDADVGVIAVDVGSVVVAGGVVSAASGVFFASDAAGDPVEVVVSEDAPLVVDGVVSGGGLAIVVDGGFGARVDDLAIGGGDVGRVTAGDVDVEGASAVFARDVDLACVDGACDGSGRVTQVVKDGDVLIAADVEIAAYDGRLDEAPFSDELEVEFSPGESRTVLFAFREKGYAGDAVVTSIVAKGDAADFIRLAATPPDGPATTIIGAMQADGSINAGEALVLVVAGPAIVVVDVITGIVDFFDDDSPALQPVPIPSWVQAGEVGTFSIVVNAPSADGGERFDASVVVSGANFDDAVVKFTVVIED